MEPVHLIRRERNPLNLKISMPVMTRKRGKLIAYPRQTLRIVPEKFLWCANSNYLFRIKLRIVVLAVGRSKSNESTNGVW